MGVDLVVPVKRLAAAKTRLRDPAGDPAAHTRLALALTLDTVAAARAARRVRTVLVVTADRAVAATLAASGIEVADDPLVGLNAAYDRGARLLRERDPRTAVGALQADLPALRPAELDAAIAAALATGRQGVHGRRRGHRHDVPPRGAGHGAGAPVRRRIGRAAPRVGGGSARRGVAEPAPRRRHPRRSCRRRDASAWAPTPAPRWPVCDFTQLSRPVRGAHRRRGGTESPPWVMTRAARRGPGPGRRSRSGAATARSIGAPPARRRAGVGRPRRGGTATANSTATRSTPAAPAPAERPASDDPRAAGRHPGGARRGGRGRSDQPARPHPGTRVGAARRPLPQPRAVLARLQRPGAGARRGPQPAAAGAGQVPRDLRVQPRRVLHGAGRRAEAPRRHRARRPQRRRPLPPRAAGPHRRRAARPSPRRTRGCSSSTSGPSSTSRASGSCAGATSPTTSAAGSRSTSSPRSSRCSPRSPSTRRTRSPTSPGSRSTSRSPCAIRKAAPSGSPG